MRLGLTAVFLAGASLALIQDLANALAQPDPRVLARQLLSRDVRQRETAFDQVRATRPESVAPEVRAALIALLDRENRLIAAVVSRGETVDKFEDPEFVASLSREVAKLQDPQAIPALSEAIFGGLPVIRALARFGEQAVPAVLKVTTSSGSHYDWVDHGLLALRFMVEGAQSRPLSAESVEAIRRAARGRLTGKQYFTTLWQAIDLGMALGDPELTAIVSALAADQREVNARGITEPGLVDRTRQLARDRLAGLPALPRPHRN